MPAKWNLKVAVFAFFVLLASLKSFYVFFHVIQGKPAPRTETALDYFTLAPMVFDSDNFFYLHGIDLQSGNKIIRLRGDDIIKKFRNYSERMAFIHTFFTPPDIRERLFARYICQNYSLFADISPPFTATWKAYPRLIPRALAKPIIVVATCQ
jgi:hypothetical protein